jgi:hypothetical protein
MVVSSRNVLVCSLRRLVFALCAPCSVQHRPCCMIRLSIRHVASAALVAAVTAGVLSRFLCLVHNCTWFLVHVTRSLPKIVQYNYCIVLSCTSHYLSHCEVTLSCFPSTLHVVVHTVEYQYRRGVDSRPRCCCSWAAGLCSPYVAHMA